MGKKSVDKWIKKKAKKKDLPVMKKKRGKEEEKTKELIDEQKEELQDLIENKKKLENKNKSKLTDKERRRLDILPDTISVVREEMKSIKKRGEKRSLFIPSSEIAMEAREKAGAGSKLIEDMSKEEYKKYLKEIQKQTKRIKGENRGIIGRLKGEKKVNAADISIIRDPIEGRILPRTYKELKEGKYENISKEMERQINKAAEGNEKTAEAMMRALDDMSKSKFRKKMERLKEEIKKIK